MNKKLSWSRYRVVRDHYAGYEAQIKRWWFPFWLMIGVNTHGTEEAATRYCERHAINGKCVRYLGRLSRERDG